MKQQLLSWTKNLSFDNKWDRMAFSNRGAYVVGWIWSQDDKFNATVMNVSADGLFKEGEATLTRNEMGSLDDAKSFVDATLKSNGFRV